MNTTVLVDQAPPKATRPRVRRYCPHHRRLCYGELYEGYDTTRIFYDCGAVLDCGYFYWQRPRIGKRGQRLARSRPLSIPRNMLVSMSGSVAVQGQHSNGA